METHHRFGIAVGVALATVVFCHARGGGSWLGDSIGGWDAFAVTFLFLAWLRLLNADPHKLARIARLQHTSRTLIIVFILGGAIASLASAVLFLGSAKAAPTEAERTRLVVAALGTVALSWLLVHTVFALYYAWLFYRPPAKASTARHACGLIFPDTPQPDYLDFAYFSFVIGMTSQVSDVQIGSSSIRRWALLHGLVSFIFNATILALSMNIVSGLF